MGAKTFREIVESSPVVFLLSVAVTAFGLGFGGFYKLVSWTGSQIDTPKEIADLKDAAANAALAAKKPTPPEAVPIPEYTEGVNTFLASQPREQYQWDGYVADLNELNSLVQHFLSYAQVHPTNYTEAQSFYIAIDNAASMVTLRAYREFDTAKEASTENYNWKVYGGPSKFRVHTEELKEEHEEKGPVLSGALIVKYQKIFTNWRGHESGML